MKFKKQLIETLKLNKKILKLEKINYDNPNLTATKLISLYQIKT